MTTLARYSDVMYAYRLELMRKLWSGELSKAKYVRLIDKTFEWEDRYDEQTEG